MSENEKKEAPEVAEDKAEDGVEGASSQVEAVADSLQEAAEEASSAAQDAASHTEHEVLSGVASALHMLQAELKRANDLREFEARQAEKVVEDASETATAPVAEIVEEAPPVKKVRRGARKVAKK